MKRNTILTIIFLSSLFFSIEAHASVDIITANEKHVVIEVDQNRLNDSKIDDIVNQNPNLDSITIITNQNTKDSEAAFTSPTNNAKSIIERAIWRPRYKITNKVNLADSTGGRIRSYVLPPGQESSYSVKMSATASVSATGGASYSFISGQIGMKVSGTVTVTESARVKTPYKIGKRAIKSNTHDIYKRFKNKRFTIWKLEKGNYAYKSSPVAKSLVGHKVVSKYTFK